MSDVATAAKVSKSSLYKVAGNKLDLFFLVCKEQFDRERCRIEEALDGVNDPVEVVRLLLLASVPTHRERPEFYAIIFDLISASLRYGHFHEKFAHYYDEIEAKWHNVIMSKIRAGFEQGVFQASIDAEMFLEIIHAWMDHNWMEFMLKSDMTIDDVRRRIEMFTDSLLQWVTKG